MQMILFGLITLGAALVILFCPPAHKAFNEMVDPRSQEGSADLPESSHLTILNGDSVKRRITLRAGVDPSGASCQLRRRNLS